MNGFHTGCKHCPVTDCPTIQYRGSACSAARAQAGADFDPLTHGERVRKLDDSGLAAFLHMARCETPPWCSNPGCGKETCQACIQEWIETPIAKPRTDANQKKEE